MEQAHVITVWTGDVNADQNYTSMPNGVALFYDNPNNLHSALLNAKTLLPVKKSELQEFKHNLPRFSMSFKGLDTSNWESRNI